VLPNEDIAGAADEGAAFDVEDEGIERGEDQAADVESGAGTDDQAVGRVEGDRAGGRRRRHPRLRIDQAAEHRAVEPKASLPNGMIRFRTAKPALPTKVASLPAGRNTDGLSYGAGREARIPIDHG
jgi:hypothetical protein